MRGDSVDDCHGRTEQSISSPDGSSTILLQSLGRQSVLYRNGHFAKIHAQTKHIALKYHHFKGHVEPGRIQINYIHTERQQADILMKPVRTDLFPKLRYMLMGW